MKNRERIKFFIKSRYFFFYFYLLKTVKFFYIYLLKTIQLSLCIYYSLFFFKLNIFYMFVWFFSLYFRYFMWIFLQLFSILSWCHKFPNRVIFKMLFTEEQHAWSILCWQTCLWNLASTLLIHRRQNHTKWTQKY